MAAEKEGEDHLFLHQLDGMNGSWLRIQIQAGW